MLDSPLQSWEPDLLRSCGMCTRSNITCGHFNRVMVLDTATSTQDIARAAAISTKPPTSGLIVTAFRQTAGRGRLGRSWADTAHLGLAITFVVDAPRFAPGILSLAAGLATAWTVGDIVDPNAAGVIGLKWPNDVIERVAPHRKLAGVLIEQSDDLAFIGIGINVNHTAADFPTDLQERAASLAMLGAPTDRLEVATRLITRLNIALSLSQSETTRRWKALDLLTGTTQSFETSGEQIRGKIISIDPLDAITIETPAGPRRLPVMTTQILKDQGVHP